MARSVGEAAATGLESGFRLAMDYKQMQRQNERQDAADREHMQDRTRTMQRQDDATALAGLDSQDAALGRTMQGYADTGTTPDAQTQQQLSAQSQGLQDARAPIIKRMTGFDPAAAKKQTKADIEAINAGTATPEQLVRGVTGATGMNPAMFLAGPNGEPPQIITATQDIASGDMQRMVRGLNVTMAPLLNKGIGEQSPHGGTIIAKRIEAVTPDPNSSEDDPKVIPMLRVYVNNGKAEASGDEIHARRAMDPDAPAGATGHYLAPMTEGRSANAKADDKVKSISINAGMNRVEKLMQLAEQLNRPEARALIEQNKEFNPDEWLAMQREHGIKTRANKVDEYTLPQGAIRQRDEYGPDGKLVSSRRTEGQPKEPAKNKQEELLQAKLDAIEEDSDLSPKEKKAARLAVMSGIKPGKYAGTLGSAAPATGGGGKPGDTSKSDDKRIGRALQSLKEDRLDLEKRKEVVLAEYKADIDGEGPKERAAAKAVYNAKMAKLSEEDAGLKRKMQAIDESVGLGDAKPAPGAKPAAAGGKQPTVIKFDKNGNRVTN